MKFLQWASLALIIVVAMLIDVPSPTGSEVPEPRYHVVSVQDGLTLYLTFASIRNEYRQLWVVSEDQAWRYSSRVTAQADSDRYGGTVVPIRG